MAAPRMKNFKRFTVILGDPEDESTWESHEVQSIGRDMSAVEVDFSRRNWKVSERPVTAQAMLGYYAMRRTGRIPADFSWSDFEAAYLEVANADEAEDVTPTQPAPEAGF